MLDRLLKLVVVLTLLLFLAQALIGVLVRSLEVGLLEMASGLGHAGGILLALLVGCALVGVLVRSRAGLSRLLRPHGDERGPRSSGSRFARRHVVGGREGPSRQRERVRERRDSRSEES